MKLAPTYLTPLATTSLQLDPANSVFAPANNAANVNYLLYMPKLAGFVVNVPYLESPVMTTCNLYREDKLLGLLLTT